MASDADTDTDAGAGGRYRRLLEELFGARRAGVVFGLERMREILEKLGHPERRLGAIVHVGGTNGKGSTVAMIAAMVRAHGLRTAQYTSPHLATVRERIADDEGWIDRASFLAAAEEVWAAGGAALTFFEQLTAIALVALPKRRPEVTVLEVGLGGRLDATNAVESDVAVVTGVALDHQAMLGSTLELIAGEKAGIFRAGKPAVIGRSGEEEGLGYLVQRAAAIGAAPIQVVTEAAIAAVQPEWLALRGEHQRRNAAVALAAIAELVRLGVLPDDAAARRRGLGEARHPGRFEKIGEAPVILVDGAHNPHGAQALAEALDEAVERAQLPPPRVLVLAVSGDKDVAGIAGPLVDRFEAVVATAYRQERTMPAEALAEALRRIIDARSEVPIEVHAESRTEARTEARIEVAPEVEEALRRARAIAGDRGSIVVAGSLFLVGEARVSVLGGEVDPIRLSDPGGLGARP
jgi:dihydrofolate synthase / folylpolyglutamate synthase